MEPNDFKLWVMANSKKLPQAIVGDLVGAPDTSSLDAVLDHVHEQQPQSLAALDYAKRAWEAWQAGAGYAPPDDREHAEAFMRRVLESMPGARLPTGEDILAASQHEAIRKLLLEHDGKILLVIPGEGAGRPPKLTG